MAGRRKGNARLLPFSRPFSTQEHSGTQSKNRKLLSKESPFGRRQRCYNTDIRVKNIVDTIFFTPDVFAAERLQTSSDPIGENAFACFSSGAALASGMAGKSEISRTGKIRGLRAQKPRICENKRASALPDLQTDTRDETMKKHMRYCNSQETYNNGGEDKNSTA
jgi:hypothetical protein